MKTKLLCALLCLLLLAACGGKTESGPASEMPAGSVPASAPPLGPASEIQSAQAMVKLVVPEGYTLPKIGMALEEMGICTTEEWIAAAQNGDFSDYALVAQQPANENRCYTLEGYLFPATYEFLPDATPEDIIRRMLQATEQRLTADLRAQIAAGGYTVDEVLTLASVIEKEAYGVEVMAAISSVLHNRLNAGWKLECDVTISYVMNVIAPFVENGQARYAEYYNTYKCPALPAGAICNPGMAAIQAAIAPADTNYFFFVTDSENNFYFSETLEQHEAYIEAIKNGELPAG